MHFGVGAFHRTHQALYVDEAMDAGDRDWAIIGVSPRSGAARDALAPQDGLYTLTERSAADDRTRVIGALKGVLVAPREPEAVIAALAAVDTRIVSLTLTEKGYLRGPDGRLDLAAAGDPAAPASVYGFLAMGLARRRAVGLPGVTLLSCDNLPANGRSLAALLTDYLSAHDDGLAGWVAAECAAPDTMVDRITPAATAGDRRRAAEVLGVEDKGAVVAEPFRQWVIEDRFAGPRPRWEVGGARFVADVRPYETAKLRLLNGAHSALAYLGLARGHAHVHQAMADGAIAPLIERLMRREAAASFDPAPGQDLDAYADALLVRFANTALPHRLAQIAVDGSQKIPQRWLATLADSQARGRDCPATLAALAAWMAHARGDNGPVDDPLAERLMSIATRLDARGAIEALFGQDGLIRSRWRPSVADRETLIRLLAPGGG